AAVAAGTRPARRVELRRRSATESRQHSVLRQRRIRLSVLDRFLLDVSRFGPFRIDLRVAGLLVHGVHAFTVRGLDCLDLHFKDQWTNLHLIPGVDFQLALDEDAVDKRPVAAGEVANKDCVFADAQLAVLAADPVTFGPDVTLGPATNVV